MRGVAAAAPRGPPHLPRPVPVRVCGDLVVAEKVAICGQIASSFRDRCAVADQASGVTGARFSSIPCFGVDGRGMFSERCCSAVCLPKSAESVQATALRLDPASRRGWRRNRLGRQQRREALFVRFAGEAFQAGAMTTTRSSRREAFAGIAWMMMGVRPPESVARRRRKPPAAAMATMETVEVRPRLRETWQLESRIMPFLTQEPDSDGVEDDGEMLPPSATVVEAEVMAAVSMALVHLPKPPVLLHHTAVGAVLRLRPKPPPQACGPQ